MNQAGRVFQRIAPSDKTVRTVFRVSKQCLAIDLLGSSETDGARGSQTILDVMGGVGGAVADETSLPVKVDEVLSLGHSCSTLTHKHKQPYAHATRTCIYTQCRHVHTRTRTRSLSHEFILRVAIWWVLGSRDVHLISSCASLRVRLLLLSFLSGQIHLQQLRECEFWRECWWERRERARCTMGRHSKRVFPRIDYGAFGLE